MMEEDFDLEGFDLEAEDFTPISESQSSQENSQEQRLEKERTMNEMEIEYQRTLRYKREEEEIQTKKNLQNSPFIILPTQEEMEMDLGTWSEHYKTIKK